MRRPTYCAISYSANGMESFIPLTDKLTAELEDKQQMKLLTEIELPFAEVLASMENIGFAVDRQGIGICLRMHILFGIRKQPAELRKVKRLLRKFSLPRSPLPNSRDITCSRQRKSQRATRRLSR